MSEKGIYIIAFLFRLSVVFGMDVDYILLMICDPLASVQTRSVGSGRPLDRLSYEGSKIGWKKVYYQFNRKKATFRNCGCTKPSFMHTQPL